MLERKNNQHSTAKSTDLIEPKLKSVPGAVRILSGQWRRSVVMVANAQGLRPTPERVRETVFDWLGHLLGGLEGRAILDMYAGSGAMGLEAASRGAQWVTWLDTNRAVVKSIKATLTKFQYDESRGEVLLVDALAFIERTSRQFDVIFIDPPFMKKLQKRSVECALRVLKSEGLIYVESPEPCFTPGDLEQWGLVRIREAQAGSVHYELLARAGTQLAQQVRLPKQKTRQSKKMQEEA